MSRIIIFIAIGLAVIGLISVVLFYNKTYYSVGNNQDDTIFIVQEGSGVKTIAQNLKDDEIISCKLCFLYYVWKNDVAGKIIAGEYEFSSNVTIPEIVRIITTGENVNASKEVRITFPEGWTSREMAKRLNANNLPGDDFLEIVNNPPADLIAQYYFLKDLGEGDTLEGFLFPDTYDFYREADAESIVLKMLNNFDIKLTDDLSRAIDEKNRSIRDIIIMASLIEHEVNKDEDRPIVSDIFWKRVDDEYLLQSCATLAYILNEHKKQYSYEDTQVDSSYNTYLNPGLPPGPVSNPGLLAINAAIYPQENDYYYFLNDTETGETVFSKTLEEHNANKVKHGL